MDGVHDPGGTHGYGRMPERWDNLTFHQDWEPLGYVIAMLTVRAGVCTGDALRYAIERLAPHHYVTMQYQERFVTAVASVCVEKGIISLEELEQKAGGRFPLSTPGVVGDDCTPRSERFRSGDQVVAGGGATLGHSRAPRYTRGKRGVILSMGPLTSFAGRAAVEPPGESREEHTYRDRFEASELWPDVDDGSAVVVDLFESYLTPA